MVRGSQRLSQTISFPRQYVFMQSYSMYVSSCCQLLELRT